MRAKKPRWTKREKAIVERMSGYYPLPMIVEKVQTYQRKNNLPVRSPRSIGDMVRVFNKTQAAQLNNVKATELSRILGIAQRTVLGWIENNGLPAKRASYCYAIDFRELLRWMRKNPRFVSRVEADRLKWIITQAGHGDAVNQIVSEIKSAPPTVEINAARKVKSLKTGKTYDSIAQASKAEFVSRTCISDRLKKTWRSKAIDVDFEVVS